MFRLVNIVIFYEHKNAGITETLNKQNQFDKDRTLYIHMRVVRSCCRCACLRKGKNRVTSIGKALLTTTAVNVDLIQGARESAWH